jgi:hypothetical protein
MDFDTAIKLVADDQRASWPELSDGEAVDHARNTVNPDTLDAPGTRLHDAYLVVLTAKPIQIVAAFRP